MNWPALVLGGVITLLLLPGSRKLVKGKVYAATYRPPQGSLLGTQALSQLSGIMPAGSLLAANSEGLLVVTFTSVSDREIGDFDTPLGKFELVSVKPV